MNFQVSATEKLRFLYSRINYCSSFVLLKILLFNLKFYVMWISFEKKVKLVPIKQIDSLLVFDTFDCRNTFDSYCNYLWREKFNIVYSIPHA